MTHRSRVPALVQALAVLLLGVCTAALPLHAIIAQGAPPLPPPAAPGRPRPDNRQTRPRRAIVDKLQQRVDMVLRNRLRLTDDQFNKLRAMNSRLDAEKQAVRAEEQEVRRALRQQLLPGATPNEARVAELLDKLPQVERKRIALQEREQQELAGFLRPVQRARYFALQDELRRSLQEVQRRRGTAPRDSLSPSRSPRGAGGRRPPGFPG